MSPEEIYQSEPQRSSVSRGVKILMLLILGILLLLSGVASVKIFFPDPIPCQICDPNPPKPPECLSSRCIQRRPCELNDSCGRPWTRHVWQIPDPPSIDFPIPDWDGLGKTYPFRLRTIYSANTVVHLIYNDATLPDAERAKLIAIISTNTPYTDWRHASQTYADESIEGLIQLNYGLSSLQFPNSVALLNEIILAANPKVSAKLRAESRLLIPPVPIHVRSNDDSPGAPIRFYDRSNQLSLAHTMAEVSAESPTKKDKPMWQP